MYRDHAEHGMRHIEGVAPVVISDVSVVLLDREKPPTQHLEKESYKCEHIHFIKRHRFFKIKYKTIRICKVLIPELRI